MKWLFACALAAAPAWASDYAVTYPYDGSFEDALFSVESAIIGAGLVIDHRSHTGEMLERTRADVGGAKLFDGAEIFMFCSATVSREVMEQDPDLIAFCPYAMFVTDRDGSVEIGYRTYPDGPMDAVEDLLDTIAQEALAF
ncbi:DUF302 domain-containing protein [Marinovum sp. 2_MG-2023]|uniref:DUF302 domain-containing protein n=1 Tax=Roseobacteraceae TaxID=2854170 RepID=UPI001FD06491|nr:MULTISPECIES: DUF302 domain-containing protein [Roseobacteraceae]MCJ7875037.1 DUF302 domain-containing protein [Phaeobacter sp. J2-8]MDO6730643.1 DUF302 domain-containing protein [Marinovum sp. 2_MG-2023]MDO6778794.1 DUF302 domain-containing protein [Marinovum sp. 1_MG-2023]